MDTSNRGNLSRILQHHQAYLEKLQFEQNTLRSWSNMVQDQIMGEAAQAHLQLMQMVWTMQRLSNPQPWAQGWADRSSSTSTSTCTAEQPNLRTVPSQTSTNSTTSNVEQASSSSMSSATVTVPFPHKWVQICGSKQKQNQHNQQ